jgi:hypothetical protein
MRFPFEPNVSIRERALRARRGSKITVAYTSFVVNIIVGVFTGGSIQMLTDVSIHPAGNFWAANSWDVLDGAAGDPPAYPTSTWGRRIGLHRNLWSSPSKTAAYGLVPRVLTANRVAAPHHLSSAHVGVGSISTDWLP